MKNTSQRPNWGRSEDAIPRTFTMSRSHHNYLLHRKKSGARSLSHVIRELIDADMVKTGYEGGDNGNS